VWSAATQVLRLACSFRYGVHPFYLEHRYRESTKTSASHGVFLNSAAGADILLLTPSSSKVSIIEYRMLGGTLDFYFFSGPSSQRVVEQYSEVSGKPAMNPLWAFGFHLSRWGYKNINEVKNVVAKMKAANIPLDGQFVDGYMYT
jgi:alpha-glucosidase